MTTPKVSRTLALLAQYNVTSLPLDGGGHDAEHLYEQAYRVVGTEAQLAMKLREVKRLAENTIERIELAHGINSLGTFQHTAVHADVLSSRLATQREELAFACARYLKGGAS